jgi:serine/threonine protein kinase
MNKLDSNIFESENNAERLENLLSEFDNAELANRQRDRYNNTEDKNAILEDIAEIVAERKQIVNETFIPIESAENGLFAEHTKRQGQILKVVAESVKQAKEESLGFGNVAKVAKIKKYPKYCYKVITNPTDYKEENNVKIEMELLALSRNINKSKVKIPRPIYCLANRETHMYVMETMDAAPLVSLFLEENKKALEKFEIEKFFNELQKCLDELHAKGIHHRDIHLGNVMVDFKTGRPCLIDFGKSIKVDNDSENPYEKEIEKGDEKGIKTWLVDNIEIKKIKEIIKKESERTLC